jgi:hypothetical protein
VWEQIGVQNMPSTYYALRNKYGFKDFFDKTTKIVDYCPGCGRKQRIKPGDRKETPQAERHLCQYCALPAYIPVKSSKKVKYIPARSDYFFDQYQQAILMMDNPDFDSIYEEEWKVVKVVLDDPEAPQYVYSDWLNQSVRLFFTYVQKKYGPIIKYDPADGGCVFLFIKQLSDYMSMSGNVRSNRGEKTYGAWCSENLSVPKRCRSNQQFIHPFQIYNDGCKVKNTLRRQEERSLVFNEWRQGRLCWLPKRKIHRRIHLTLVFEQADWLMLEEILLWMNFKNPHWAFFSQPLISIKAHDSASHRYYPQHLSNSTLEDGPRTAKELAEWIEASGSKPANQSGCKGLTSLAGGNHDIGVSFNFQLEFRWPLICSLTLAGART